MMPRQNLPDLGTITQLRQSTATPQSFDMPCLPIKPFPRATLDRVVIGARERERVIRAC